MGAAESKQILFGVDRGRFWDHETTGIALKSLICARNESTWTFPSDVQFLF